MNRGSSHKLPGASGAPSGGPPWPGPGARGTVARDATGRALHNVAHRLGPVGVLVKERHAVPSQRRPPALPHRSHHRQVAPHRAHAWMGGRPGSRPWPPRRRAVVPRLPPRAVRGLPSRQAPGHTATGSAATASGAAMRSAGGDRATSLGATRALSVVSDAQSRDRLGMELQHRGRPASVS